MLITIELISFSIILSLLLGIIQFLVSIWIKSRLEQSIRHAYDKKLEDYRFTINQREQAAKIAELFAKWIKYTGSKYNKEELGFLDEGQRADYFEELNRLTWELALWVPDEALVNEIMKRLGNAEDALKIKEIIIKTREFILHKKTEKLEGKNIIHFE